MPSQHGKSSDDDSLGQHLDRLAAQIAPALQDSASGPLDEASLAMINHIFEHYNEEIHSLCEQFIYTERKRGGAAARSITPESLITNLYMRFRNRPMIAEKGKQFFFLIFYSESRRILIDRHRKKKRRDDTTVQSSSVSKIPAFEQVDYRQIDLAISKLQAEEPRAAMIAQMYVYGLPSVEEGEGAQALRHSDIANMTGYSLRTVELDWRYAKSFLHAELFGPSDSAP